MLPSNYGKVVHRYLQINFSSPSQKFHLKKDCSTSTFNLVPINIVKSGSIVYQRQKDVCGADLVVKEKGPDLTDIQTSDLDSVFCDAAAHL